MGGREQMAWRGGREGLSTAHLRVGSGNVVTGMSSGDMYIWKSRGDAKGSKGAKKAPGFQCERRVLTQTDPKKPPSRAHASALQASHALHCCSQLSLLESMAGSHITP